MKIINIIKGWYRFLFFKQSKEANRRMLYCWGCEERRGVFCGMCGCELHAKTEVREEKCPKNKW